MKVIPRRWVRIALLPLVITAAGRAPATQDAVKVERPDVGGRTTLTAAAPVLLVEQTSGRGAESTAMETVNNPVLISKAIVLWTGWGRNPFPVRDEAALVERYGETAVDLLPIITRLDDEFFRSNARHIAADLPEMGELAAQDFRKLHPEITNEAITALAWCYTFEHK